jgi:hypothetical protein
MAAIAGKAGWVKVGSDSVAMVESWDVSISDEALQTTGLGATYRSYIGRGLPEGTGSLTWRALDLTDTASLVLKAAMLANTTPITLSLSDDGTNHWGSSAVVTGFTHTTPVEGLVTGSCQFTLTGAITYGA